MLVKSSIFFLRRMIFIFLLALPGLVEGQAITDTVFHVQTVVISASRNDHFSQDVKTEEFNDSLLNLYAGESLGRLLTGETALNIKSNGVGGAASSLSIRGTSSSHVQINWNGFPINSLTLGSADISMIPAAGFERITISYGASGALFGSGTFGGAVNLFSDLNPEKELSGSIFSAWNSLQTFNGGISLKAGSSRIAGRLFAWGAASANEFTYYDYIRQRERKQTDGSWNDYGLIQNMALKLSASSTLDAGLWYQVKPYNIPSRIGSTSFEHQSDSTLKLYLGYKYLSNRWSLKLKTARFSDHQYYSQKASANVSENSIVSRIASVQYYGDADFRYYLPSGLSFDAGMTISWLSAEVSAYGGRKEERGAALFAGIKQSFKHLALQAVFRKEWYNTFNSGILPSFGLKWETLPERLTIRANYSKKYRKPTFNDLYWVPGGNPNLHPEKGFTIETGTEAILLKSERIIITADISPYYTHVREMIVWLPSGLYWMPVNYQSIKSLGSDQIVKIQVKNKKTEYNSLLKVSLNHSISIEGYGDEKTPMLYSPRIITSWKNNLIAGIFNLEVLNSFTADRFYDENRLLEPYHLADVRAGVLIPAGRGSVRALITCHNLANTTYELIRLYPMPGRYWAIKLDYSF